MPYKTYKRPASFKPGKSGNPPGRPKGSVNKFTKIREDWLKAYQLGGGVKLFSRLIKEDLSMFMRLGVSMLPKEIDAEIHGNLVVEIVHFAQDQTSEQLDSTT